MATVWTFGDSLTERYNDRDEWSKQYIKWKGYVPKVYGDFVSGMLNYDLQNLGKAGCDNYTIFETFCKTYPLIQNEDIVIIGWTSCARFRLINKFNEWGTLNPNFENRLKDFEYLSKDTVNEIFANRTHIEYTNEVNSWISFINSACVGKKIIHWNTIKGDGELNTYHFFEMETINTETNGLINDYHFSEKGQKHLASEIIDIIFNKEKLIKASKII